MKRKQLSKCILAWLFTLILVCTLIPQQAMAETIYIDKKAEVAFVIDATGSMSPYIESVKNNLSAFISQINSADVDVRVRFVVFRDITCDEDTVCSGWFTDAESAIGYLNGVTASGGGDGPETLLDGLGAALSETFGFRSDAAKFCIALTDASTKLLNSYGFKSEKEVITNLEDRGIITSMIASQANFEAYEKYVGQEDGILADIAGDYSIVLKNLGDVIIGGTDKFVTTGITPTYTEEGTPVTVRVYGKDVTYAKDFGVCLGSKTMVVTSKEDSYFEFKVPASMAVGRYAINVSNNGVTTKIGTFRVVKKVKPIGKMKMTPNSSIEGVRTTVKVTCPNMTYAKDFAIKLGTVKMSIAYKGDDYFKFNVPATMPAGSYMVTMTNDGAEGILGGYEVIKKPVPEIHMKMSQTTSKEGTAQTVKVDVSGGKLSYKDFSVKVGGKKMSVTYKGDSYFKFSIPATMSDGTYTVVVSNEGDEYTLGDYVITPKPGAPALVLKMSQTTSKAGTVATVKVAVSGGKLTYKNFVVKLNGTKMTVTYKGDSYFKFTIPADAADGTYTVMISDDGTEYTIGDYIVTPKPAEPERTMTLGQTSSTQGTAASVKVIVSGGIMSYKSDFCVKFGTTKMTVSYKGDEYFIITVPASFANGTYVVSVTNGSKTTEIGNYKIKEKVIPEPTFGKLSVTKGKSAVRTIVKVDYSNMTYASDFKVEVGGVKAVMSYKGDSYFKFYTPTGLAAGTYDVIVTNKGKQYTIGSFTFTS